jgi:glucosamine--fructose-6-phosphate aminotransferase (isomerizing)
MCGIIGYLGNKNCIDYLLSGLQKLQNRGYDSAGISIINNNNLYIKKYASTDQINAIEYLTNAVDIPNSVLGIGHTRWATHGEKTDVNAHPHCDDKQRVALVHNGIIENYRELKHVLVSAGYVLQSQTDTEIIAVTIGMYLDNGFEINDAIKETLSKLNGSWALCIMHIDYPNKIWVARNGSPLLLGIEDDYIMIASESIAFGKYIQKYIVLDNNDLIEISISNNKISYANNMQRYKLKDNLSITDYELPDNYAHWMIKEIYDQPDSIEKALNNGGRIHNSTSVKLGGLDNLKHRFREH